ncbi:MAG: hypothetical protein MJ123_05760 [Lachnospiraceae bacterium]|nr:hypothetical protein [Lachnospiraceae bacterium]
MKNDVELTDSPTFFLIGVNAEKFSKAFSEDNPDYELIHDNGTLGNITTLYYRKK